MAIALAKVVEGDSNGNVRLAERALSDGEALLVERHCLLVIADASMQDRKVVERHRYVCVPFT